MSGAVRTDGPVILVVDDVRENLVAIEAALQGLAGRVVLASSGEEALRYLLEHDVALILLDVQMPTLGGLETARLIRSRKRCGHVPIIFLTAHQRNDEQVLRAYRLGAVDFLFKPINAEVLVAKASVFVELQRRTAEVEEQACLIKQHEEAVRERALSDQRRTLEAEALRVSLAEQRRHAEILRVKNQELETIRAQLEHSNERLAAADRRKDEFIALLAHELRNPLSALMSGIELLETAPSADSRGLALPIMRRQGKHLIRLVDDLLDMSRVNSGKMRLRKQLVRLGEILDAGLELAQPAIDARGHSLDVDRACDEAWLHGDSVRLAQIVANLLNNAARYTPKAGRIRLSTRREGDRLCIVVEDDGRGISPALLERVFDMFVQAESGGGGLGLGLTLVDQLTRMHDGEVEAFSEGEGHGSRFEVRLPEVGPPGALAHAVPVREVVGSSLRIVLVDDHADVLGMTRAVLEQAGHDVATAMTGSAGVELILDARPDLAIVDIGLPDILGYEVARRVREALGPASPRMIAMTGYGQHRDRARAIRAGFDAHVSKPATSDALRAVMLHPQA